MKTRSVSIVEMFTAGEALEMLSGSAYRQFPEGTAFYVKVAGANVRIDRHTAEAVLLACDRNGRLNGKATDGEAVWVVRFDAAALMCDIG